MTTLPTLPRSVRDRLDVTRRDLKMLWESLTGRPPSPLVDRPAKTYAPPPPGLATRTLRIARVDRETDDAVSLWLEDPTGADVEYVPGEFLTVLVDVGGRTLRRAYSLSRAPRAGEPARITVKRIRDGVVSNHLNDHAEIGQLLKVRGPSGNFVWPREGDRAAPSADRLVLVGGGSGITPLFAIAEAALGAPDGPRVDLVFANRTPEATIFREALEALAAVHGERFVWRDVIGDLSADAVPVHPDAIYYLCGPDGLTALVSDALDAAGVPRERVRHERFRSPGADATPIPTTAQPAVIRLGDQRAEVVVAPGQTVLEAGVAAGLPMPFSCAMGGCGRCRCTLDSGQVVMEEPNCLTDLERQSGQILACVARPTAPIAVSGGAPTGR